MSCVRWVSRACSIPTRACLHLAEQRHKFANSLQSVQHFDSSAMVIIVHSLGLHCISSATENLFQICINSGSYLSACNSAFSVSHQRDNLDNLCIYRLGLQSQVDQELRRTGNHSSN